jgi:thiol-disulfide isomerase/thioredoxin
MILPILFLVISITLSFSSLIKSIVISGYNNSLNAVGICLQYLILWAGTIVTFALLWYEIDKMNPFLQKVCTGIVKGNCNSILTGKRSKIFSWLSWSEVGFFYFTGGLLSMLFLVNSIKGGISVIAFLNLSALPYTVFSIYYQWRIAKQWCILCLAVQALLVLGAINVLVTNLLQTISGNGSLLIIETIFLYAFPVMLLFSIKPYLLQLQEIKNTKREYLRIKFNTEIFETLLKKQKTITVPFEGLGIDLGNPNASNTLIKVCNPYCGPCAKAHPIIEQLIEENENIRAKIIFTTSNHPESKSYKPTAHLLAIAEQNDELKIKRALDDWYIAEKKKYDSFATKYTMNEELLKQGNKIDAMDKWCKEMNIRGTPTYFLNGYQIPEAYVIGDLKYFLAE